MSFFAGAVIAKAIMDTTGWVAGSKTMNSSMNKMGGVFNTLGKIGTVAIGAITAAFAKSVLSANEWQKEFSNVTTLLDTTQINTQAMAKELLLLDARLGDSTDLTKGLYQALSASVEPTQAVNFVAESAKFAKAALVDTNTAVDVITTGLNAYGYEASRATEISDQLFSVIKLGKTTGAELASVIGKSIPLAANMGIGFDQLGASIAVMTRQGINAANATTQFNAVINAFLKPSDAMLVTLDRLGYSSGSAAIEALGLKGAIDLITQSAGGSKDELAAMFSNTRALRGVLALTGEGASDFDDILKEIQESAGATNTAFEKQELTFDTLKNTLKKGEIIIGNIGKVFADELAVGATQAAQGMIDFLVSSQGADLVSDIIANLSAGFEALKIIIEPLIDTVLENMKDIWNTLTKSLDKIFGKTQESTGGFKVFAVAGQLVNSVLNVLTTIIKSVITNISNLVTAITESGNTIGSFFDFLVGKKTWEQVEEQASKAGNAFIELGKGVVDGIGDIFGAVISEASDFEKRVNKTATDVEVKWKVTYDRVKTNTKETYDSMITGQSNFADNFKKTAQDILDALNNTNDKTKEDTEDTVDEMTNIWTDYFNEIKEKASDTSQSMLDLFKASTSALGEGFRSSFETLGEMMVLGEEASKSFGEALKDSVLEAVAKILQALAAEFLVRAAAAALWGRWGKAAGWTAAAALAYTSAGAVKALQEGGPAMANEPVLVGESGPELFIPDRSGQVFSNEDSRTFFNNPITNNFYVNNLSDAERVSQLLGRRLKNTGKGI